MDVLIVGAGTMGRWFGEAVDAPVSFADVDESIAREAATAVGGTVAALDGEGATADRYDAVCVAVPMGHVAAVIETQVGRAERAILDVSGVMEPALSAMATHGAELERLSLHPLFAPDRAPGSIPYVADAPGPVTDSILANLEERGNELLETTPEEHDGAMSTIQAAAHASILSFALAAEPVPAGYETPIYSGLCDLTDRLLGGTPRVYADIQRTFDGADRVAEAADRIATAGDDELEALHRDAASRWDRLAADGDREDATDAREDAPDGREAATDVPEHVPDTPEDATDDREG